MEKEQSQKNNTRRISNKYTPEQLIKIEKMKKELVESFRRIT